MTPGPNTESPRFQIVTSNAVSLLEVAVAHGALGMALCESVARGEDHDGDEAAGRPGSDIDFYAFEFLGDEDARERAEALVEAYQSILAPFKVDVRGWPCLPGFLLDDHERYERDALMLSTFVD